MARSRRSPDRWVLYTNDDPVLEPALFQTVGDTLPKEGRSAFDVADKGGALKYPSREWWEPIRKRARDREVAAATPPTVSKSIEKRLGTAKGRARLLRATPLPGESKARARARVKEVRSYFGQLGAFVQAEKRANTRAEYRVGITGRVFAAIEFGKGSEEVGEGTQWSQWMPIANGAKTPSAIEIRALYLDTARAATRTTTGDHGPGNQLSKMIPENLDYERVNIVPDECVIEVRIP